ncbi:peroxiredoxin, partial [bacterium]|nr:peroxiredoxin [bacterium]
YGVLLEGGMALRGTFLIDKEGMVQHMSVNNLGLGRSVDEALRMIDALQHLEEHGEVCPANWSKGDDAMTPTADGVAKYLSDNA